MSRTLSLGVALATLLFAVPAGAAVMVVGVVGGPAQSCYRAAVTNDNDFRSIRNCNNALDDLRLTNENRAATHVNRGILHNSRGNYSEALADFDAAIRITPDLAEAHTNRGIALIGRNDYRGAVHELNQAISLGPAEPAKAYYNRAIAHEELGDVRAAYNDYRRASELAPAWDSPRTELARFQVRR